MPNGKESLFEGEIKEARVRMPEKLQETLNAMASQLNANTDCVVNRHKLACYVLADYVSNHWEGRISYEEKKKIFEFAESEGDKL